MKYKTSELTGALLDAAVSKAADCEFKVTDAPSMQKTLVMALGPDGQPWWPSLRWEHGGPIIERERIGLWAGEEPYHGVPAPKDWFAEVAGPRYPGEFKGRGPTPLIAAMRAYATSKLGEEVEL